MSARGWRTGALAALILLATSATSDAASERSVRVGPEYFGVNYPLMAFDTPEVRERQLRSIRDAGLESVRVPLSWQRLEPNPPDESGHHYYWYSSDLQVTLLAEHGLRMMPVFFYPPRWASIKSLSCLPGTYMSAGTDKLGDYADAARALAARYGPRGSFWKEHPELPERPITTWQLWNEPNLASFWCPSPDPEGYAELFVMAANAIKQVRRSARVMTAGLIVEAPPRGFVPIPEFLGRATGARPDLWRVADGVGSHIYPGRGLDGQFAFVANLRSLLTAGGVPRSEPMFGSEIGWGLGNGLSESERAAIYGFFTERAPSTNCNLGAMFAHSWTTTPADGHFYDNATGIADAYSGDPYPSAAAYRDAIALLRGQGPREAVHPKMRNCDGMPTLDRDGDGKPEHADYYPLDPKRWRGPAEWHGKPTVTARRVQRLGRPVHLRAKCVQSCSLVATGTVRLVGERRKLRLKPDRGRAKDGSAARLTLKPDRRTKRRIARSRARRGSARITIRAISDDGGRERARTTVKLR